MRKKWDSTVVVIREYCKTYEYAYSVMSIDILAHVEFVSPQKNL